MSATFTQIGIALIIAGLLLIVSSLILALLKHPRGLRGSRLAGGGVVFIGPFPIVFASSKSMAKILLAIALLIFMVFIILEVALVFGPIG
ncbi:MAG: DUF131 domain-containing protein [Candidatus Geothermarchaeales archaeon]